MFASDIDAANWSVLVCMEVCVLMCDTLLQDAFG